VYPSRRVLRDARVDLVDLVRRTCRFGRLPVPDIRSDEPIVVVVVVAADVRFEAQSAGARRLRSPGRRSTAARLGVSYTRPVHRVRLPSDRQRQRHPNDFGDSAAFGVVVNWIASRKQWGSEFVVVTVGDPLAGVPAGHPGRSVPRRPRGTGPKPSALHVHPVRSPFAGRRPDPRGARRRPSESFVVPRPVAATQPMADDRQERTGRAARWRSHVSAVRGILDAHLR